MASAASERRSQMLTVGLPRPQLMILRRLARAELARIVGDAHKPFYWDGTPYGSSVATSLARAIRRMDRAMRAHLDARR